MGEIIVSCPHCDKKYTAKQQQHGIEITCVNCNLSFTVSIPGIQKEPLTLEDAKKIFFAYNDIMCLGNYKLIYSVDELPFTKGKILEAYKIYYNDLYTKRNNPKINELIKLAESVVETLTKYCEIAPEDLLIVRSINKKWGELVLLLYKEKDTDEKLSIIKTLNLTEQEQQIDHKYKRMMVDQFTY